MNRASASTLPWRRRCQIDTYCYRYGFHALTFTAAASPAAAFGQNDIARGPDSPPKMTLAIFGMRAASACAGQEVSATLLEQLRGELAR